MKTRILTIIAILAFILSMAISCSDPGEVTPVHQYVNTATDETLGPQGTLGRMLFYDTHLSENNTVSCASCHKQSLAFSDSEPFSKGYLNDPSLRNTIPIQNMGFSNNLFWDGRASDLNSMVLLPIFNHVEMGMDNSADLVTRVGNLSYYRDMFIKAYGSDEIKIELIGNAIAQFLFNIQSSRSRFDLNNLNALELQGQELFFNKYDCGTCHSLGGSGFYGFTVGFVNIGLDQESQDQGRFNVTNDPTDKGKFRIPSLMNVALTAPYMHDGRFATISEVLDHYSHGIANHPNLDINLKDEFGNPISMNISNDEKLALEAFLGALTDHNMISTSLYASPFKR